MRIYEYGDPDAVLVEYERVGKVAVLRLSNGRFNGYTHRMMRQLDDAIISARFDPEVEVIAIVGAGKMFCAGADIKMLEQAEPVEKYYFCLHANETLSRLEQTPKLTVAFLNGHCIGGGLEVALACDLRVAHQGAGRLGLPEVNLGVLPGTGGTQRLARALGKSRAIEWMITGKLGSFEQGKEIGLINHLIEAEGREAFVEAALDWVSQFTTPKKASMAVGCIKRAVQTGLETSLDIGLALERELQSQLFASEDAREGLAAFVERREPVFKGK